MQGGICYEENIVKAIALFTARQRITQVEMGVGLLLHMVYSSYVC